MNEAARREWMLAAGMALQHLPEDLLRQGVKAAMQTADHPSKIVAAIIADTERQYEERKRYKQTIAEHDRLLAGTTALLEDHRNRRPTPEEVDAIMTEHGIPSHYGRAAERKHLGPAREPTAADYAELKREMGME